VISFIGPGELFGEYEAFSGGKNVPLEFSLICRSVKGEVMSIDKAEFAKKLNAFRQAMPNFIDKSKEKRLLYYRQILVKRKVDKKAKLDEIRINLEQINVPRRRQPQPLYLENEYSSVFRES